MIKMQCGRVYIYLFSYVYVSYVLGTKVAVHLNKLPAAAVCGHVYLLVGQARTKKELSRCQRDSCVYWRNICTYKCVRSMYAAVVLVSRYLRCQ